MTRDALPPLREGLALQGLRAERRLGQHFLLDMNLCRKIARLAGPLEGATVIEVGPGPGGLTRALLEAGADVVAIEKDPRFLPLLGELAAAAAGRLIVVAADALEVDERALTAHAGGIRIVSNLPYNVGSALVVKWLTGPLRPAGMTLMFQKEVARRIVASAGGAEYGRLSVLAQAVCRTEVMMDLPARAFTPPPKVDSSVVAFAPRDPRPCDALLTALGEVTRSAFGQRRKMLRSSLRLLGDSDLCTRVGIDPSLRAQNVDVPTYLELASAHLLLNMRAKEDA